MAELESFGGTLVIAGSLILLSGLILMYGGKTPLGNLPGDITFEKGNFRFYAPITTFLIISTILTVLLNLFLKAN
ncbi:MAG: DUF2905 domain-containing protein [Candidatus Aenigmarchaeota archaeon]|nr:DUF2905 domain-containing protein [Candidatus Aenigmarchaeota archaeon]